jgi:hypothetical protein
MIPREILEQIPADPKAQFIAEWVRLTAQTMFTSKGSWLGSFFRTRCHTDGG